MPYKNDFAVLTDDELSTEWAKPNMWEDQLVNVPLRVWTALKERVIRAEYDKHEAETKWLNVVNERNQLADRLKQYEGGE